MKRIGKILYCAVLQISTLHGIMVLSLKMDWGKLCYWYGIAAVGPWCGSIGEGGRPGGNTLFWEDSAYRDSIDVSPLNQDVKCLPCCSCLVCIAGIYLLQMPAHILKYWSLRKPSQTWVGSNDSSILSKMHLRSKMCSQSWHLRQCLLSCGAPNKSILLKSGNSSLQI